MKKNVTKNYVLQRGEGNAWRDDVSFNDRKDADAVMNGAQALAKVKRLAHNARLIVRTEEVLSETPIPA